ncbi:MAG: hypothetical protein WA159_07155 [Variovorax sp.]
METVSITIALQDESRGYAISPRRVPLALLSSFTADVRDFVRGSEKEVDPADLDVAVVDGSFAVAVPPVFAPQLLHDIQLLQGSIDLSKIDAKRRAIMERWQSGAKASLSRAIRIASNALDRVIVIDHTTDFHALDIEKWVDVERYIQGELMDLGGVRESNAHIKLPNGKTLTVRTDKDLIKAKTDNMVYRVVHLRIRAKYNLDTGELKDPTLIEFVNYAPKFDADAFDRLTRKGAEAWKEVDDPAQWVRQLRGSNE